MKRDSIVKPPPYPGFHQKKVVYVPGDTSYHFIYKAIQKHIKNKKTRPFGQLFLLEDKIILYRCVGAPTTVMFLERLVASGASEILILGFCGSLSDRIKIHDAVSIQKAYREEGTSKHYFPRKKVYKPSPQLKNRSNRH